MFGRQPVKIPQTIGFFLTPQFSMVAFSAAIEPLRAANRVSRQDLYQWKLFSIDGEPVRASNDVEFNPDGIINENIDCDLLLVCAGVRAYDHLNKSTSHVLRALARKGIPLGSICTGSVALAEAGLLDGFRCTIHWENIESLAERYPALDITATRYEIDRNRYTCSGGLAAMEMMIDGIRLDHGHEIAMKVADQFLYTAISNINDAQRLSIDKRTGVRHPKLLAAIGHMETYLENPVDVATLSESVGISIRQLERLFRQYFNKTPAQYYRDLRLERARSLLRQTHMTVLEVAVATGFNSASYFTKMYRQKFGHTPIIARSKT